MTVWRDAIRNQSELRQENQNQFVVNSTDERSALFLKDNLLRTLCFFHTVEMIVLPHLREVHGSFLKIEKADMVYMNIYKK